MAALSEYEKNRLKNIEENQKLLQMLGLTDMKTDLANAITESTAKPKKAPRDPNKPKKKKLDPPHRQSRRLSGKPAELGKGLSQLCILIVVIVLDVL